jgi:hypothetical protein
MNDDSESAMTRVSLLQKLALAPLAIGALAMLRAEKADAAPTMDPKAAGYVTHAVDNKQCSDCSLYIPAKSSPTTSAGTCQVVTGDILPTAYCTLYSAKPK